MTCSHRFSCTLRQLQVATSGFDWFTVLSVSFVIGQSDYFGFTTLNIENCSNLVFIPVSFNFLHEHCTIVSL